MPGRGRLIHNALTEQAETAAVAMLDQLPQLIEGSAVNLVDQLRYLRVVLVLAGLACLALYPLMVFWPSGWAWHVGHSNYPMMIVGIYATLGVFLIQAACDPLAHLSLIWFTVWSSVVHGAIMTIQALSQPGQMGHLAGDVPALFIVAIALAVLTPRSPSAARPRKHDEA